MADNSALRIRNKHAAVVRHLIGLLDASFKQVIWVCPEVFVLDKHGQETSLPEQLAHGQEYRASAALWFTAYDRLCAEEPHR